VLAVWAARGDSHPLERLAERGRHLEREGAIYAVHGPDQEGSLVRRDLERLPVFPAEDGAAREREQRGDLGLVHFERTLRPLEEVYRQQVGSGHRVEDATSLV
jgi:hypothetical protein